MTISILFSRHILHLKLLFLQTIAFIKLTFHNLMTIENKIKLTFFFHVNA